jgi:Tfp pilus assembly protein PilO
MRPVDPNHKLRVLSWSMNGLGAAVACAIVLAAELAGYRPLDAQLAASSRQTGELEAVLRDGDNIRTEHARLEKELAAARVQSAELIQRIPDQPQEADFLAQLSQLADGSSLKIRDYRPGVITPKTSYATMRVDLICEGDYASLCKFLDGLAGLPRHSTLVHIEVDSAPQKDLYWVELSLELYVATAGQSDAEKR